MKKLVFVISLFVLLAISLAGTVNAYTLIAGKIYNADFTHTIPGAFVLVSCNHSNSSGYYINTKNTTSLTDGTYAVTYYENKCDENDWVTVYATKDSLYGSASGMVNGNVTHGLNIAIVNVPLVPEFGIFVGMLTLIAALGIFFIVRKR